MNKEINRQFDKTKSILNCIDINEAIEYAIWTKEKAKMDAPICTILPLTTERMNDTRWYHIDLQNQNSTVLVEQLRNISKLRIISPHRIKGKLSKITLNDWNRIDSAMQSYYSMTKWQ